MATESTRLRQAELSAVFLHALGDTVTWHNGLESKPFEVDINTLYPKRLRVYLYNATYPPGGRTLGERKIQLIVPGQPRGARGNLDNSDGRWFFWLVMNQMLMSLSCGMQALIAISPIL